MNESRTEVTILDVNSRLEVISVSTEADGGRLGGGGSFNLAAIDDSTGNEMRLLGNRGDRRGCSRSDGCCSASSDLCLLCPSMVA